ncbi:MAG: hypothetical protein ACRDK4_07935 [Solirubrobacteraceae bacterium]
MLDRDHVKNQQDIAGIASHRASVEQTALSDLRGLTPPASMAHDYRQMLAARQTLIEDVTKLGADAAANNTQAEQPLYSSSTAVVRQMAATAQSNGFKYCGELG